MNKPTTYLHPFKFGDLIASLPGIKHLYDQTGQKAVIYQRLGTPEYYDNTEDQCMGLKMFDMLRPLLEHQDYIQSYESWNGEKCDVDFSPSRDSRVIPLPNGSIHHWVWALQPQLQCNLFIPWLHVDGHPDRIFHDKILINRTQRYRNPAISYYFLQPYADRLLFVGTDSEHAEFCDEFRITIPHLKPDNFLALAQIIKSVRLTISNQSGIWHIADAMKSLRLLECCKTYPNTHPTGMDGYFFLHQHTLESQFEKLIQ